METLARPIKNLFYAERTASLKAALARFDRIWNEELSQKKINNIYTWYIKRLLEAERIDGQMTRY
jgi:hypothetical protein